MKALLAGRPDLLHSPKRVSQILHIPHGEKERGIATQIGTVIAEGIVSNIRERDAIREHVRSLVRAGAFDISLNFRGGYKIEVIAPKDVLPEAADFLLKSLRIVARHIEHEAGSFSEEPTKARGDESLAGYR